MDSTPFPRDLMEAQTDWYVTYGQLAAAPANQSPTERRSRLQELSRRIAAHPYWMTPAGTPRARMELKEAARAAAQRQMPPAIRRAV
ncbi:hypothetical protein ACIQWZ_38320 [Streptomyces sp. NPDC098077]|uniref:hypothetical protein n=1 Tax=Streptomyces TaxID=1883 RepID=UPI0034418A84|nr:hypothetical protein OG238_00205 [Streptomyces anulatus]WST90414.1 hypothetical protein OG238_41325 [Streptomyces anulatus]WSW87800.1 hypothetical protein OG536_38600 [Streptomyces anulatus]